jgi:DNA polymerase I-like protein with 3'-5' exonuclease and polymerase domains
MSSVIPDDINTLSMAEAYRFCRDALGWLVYPVHPPWAKVTDPGKQPAVRKWWEYDPHDCDIAGTFHGERPYNIGLAPRAPLVIVDLDSKADAGKSVTTFLDATPELAQVPQQKTRNGVHLVYLCPDLPKWTRANGKPHLEKLKSRVTASVNGELFFSDHSNVVLPPSRHPLDQFVYNWVIVGAIPVITWEKLQALYGFSPPADPPRKNKKSSRWFEAFKGDLASLDLVGLLEALGHPARLLDEDEGKYAILCPWENEHELKRPEGNDTSTVIWQPRGDSFGGFKCQHLHCVDCRSLEQLLAWAETTEPGIVDRFCSRKRAWEKGQTSRSGLPRVLHPDGCLESVVYSEVGRIIGPKYDWFRRGDEVVALRKVPSGFVYSDNASTQYSVSSYQVGLGALSALQAKSSLEKHMEPGYLVKDGTFIPHSFSTEFCAGLLQSGQLKEQLFDIVRVLTVPLPFRIDDKLCYPKPSYDPQLGTFLLPDAPVIKPVSLKYALQLLQGLHRDFCFTDDQSRTHAIAALLTPFARALIGWTTRTPLWFYSANRPRAGKDYLRAVTLIVYEGHAFEDLPIGRGQDAEETMKRIMSAARAGRRLMHFSNCQFHLEDPYLTQALTNPVINGRRLGSNDASSDLSIPNEIEFSLSANVGLTYREDFEPRMRKIELAYFEEDPNERKFTDKFLHRTVHENRGATLSAIAALFSNWAQEGFPTGSSDFISYPAWAETIGGVMAAAGLGDPCLPFKSKYETGGDLKTAAMTALFALCFKTFGETWATNSRIYRVVEKAVNQDEDDSGDTEALRWFGALEGTEDARKNQTKIGMQLRIFKGRVLGGIQLQIDESSAKSERHRYRFVRNLPASKGGDLGDLGDLAGFTALREKIQKNVGAHKKSESVSTENEPTKVPKVPRVPTFDPVVGRLALDLETCSEPKISRRGTPKITATREALSPWKGEIRLVTLADDAHNIQSFDLRADPLRDEIRAAIERSTLIVHNACFDLLFLKVRLGLVPAKVFCTMTASRLLSPLRSVSHSLKSVLHRYLDVALAKEHGASDWGAMVLTEEQFAYAVNDVRYLHRLQAALEVELERDDLRKVFELEMDLIPIVVVMEAHGFAVDRTKLGEMGSKAASEATLLTTQLREDFGIADLNPASPPQLLEAFRARDVQLADTDEAALVALGDPIAKSVLQYRRAAKLGASIKGLVKAIGPDGRIHARFNPTGSHAGRFSSSGPNLQNVTRGALRSCFVPSGPDRCLIVADYSQIELRIAAWYAAEAVMMEAFRAGKDLHRETAANVLGRRSEEITKDDRQLAKACNFGLIYGQGVDGFQRYVRTEYGIKICESEAADLRDKFFERYSGLKRWHSNAWQKAENGIAENCTVFGRRLLAQGDSSWDLFQLHVNFRVQGSAADVNKLAMVNVVRVLPSDVHLIATVHDELIFDSPHQLAEQYRATIKASMEDSFEALFPDVPIEVEAKICANWADK